MTSILDTIAGHAYEVTVAGEKIRLRLATPAEKAAIIKLLPRERSKKGEKMSPEEQDAWIDTQANLGPACLKATVLDHDHFTEQMWGQLISASNDEPDKYPGIVDLVTTAFKICGVGGNKDGDDNDNVRDLAAEVDETVGDVPTE